MQTWPIYKICKHSTVPGPVSGLSATSGIVQLNVSWTPPSEPMESSLCMKCVPTAVEYSATPTHQPHSTHWKTSLKTLLLHSVSEHTPSKDHAGEYVTGQASTESVRKCVSFLINTLQSPNCNNVLSCCWWTDSGCSKQHVMYISEGLLDSSQPGSGVPLHCTLHYSGWSQWYSHIPRHSLLWSGVRTAGRTAVPVQCHCHTQYQWRVVHWITWLHTTTNNMWDLSSHYEYYKILCYVCVHFIIFFPLIVPLLVITSKFSLVSTCTCLYKMLCY